MIIIPRIARTDLNTPFLHIMVQGVNKEYIFKTNMLAKYYLNLLRKNYKDYEVTMIAYCIMQNHAHLLLHTENLSDLAHFMQKVNLVFAQTYNNLNDRCGAVFRNRYKAEPIYDMKHLINCIKYIHMNPVKAGIVDICEDYRYSSYLSYLNHGPITKSKIMVDTFGKDYNFSEFLDTDVKYKFMDVEPLSSKDIFSLMDSYISDFFSKNGLELSDFFSKKSTLSDLLEYLKYDCGFRYKDIIKRLDVSYSLFQKIK